MIKVSVTSTLIALMVVLAGCGGQPPPASGPVNNVAEVTPPPAATTPVPIVRSRAIAGAGRTDPMVVLFGGQGGGGSAAAAPDTRVAVSSFPNIPTLPGFENAPASMMKDAWTGVRLTGVVQNGGYVAILEADGKSFFVRRGDRVDNTYTVVSIGPDFITLAKHNEERHFSLGG
jgi:hypothetical protein